LASKRHVIWNSWQNGWRPQLLVLDYLLVCLICWKAG